MARKKAQVVVEKEDDEKEDGKEERVEIRARRRPRPGRRVKRYG